MRRHLPCDRVPVVRTQILASRVLIGLLSATFVFFVVFAVLRPDPFDRWIIGFNAVALLGTIWLYVRRSRQSRGT
jgi:hypothetical protein